MEKILNIISYILGISLAILVLIFKNNFFLLLCILVVYLIFFGIIWIILKKQFGSIALSAGISILLAIILNKSNVLVMSDSVTFAICLSLILILGLSFLMDYMLRRRILRMYTIVTDAEVIDLIINPNSKKEMYLPVYSYKVNNELYEVSYFRFFTKNIPQIGSKKTIRINPYNYADVFFEQEKSNKFLNMCCYIFLIIVCISIIVGLF